MPLIKFLCSSGQKCKNKNDGWTNARTHGCMDAWMSTHSEKWKDSWIHGGKAGRKDGSPLKPLLGCKNATTAAASPTASHQSLPVVYVLVKKQWAHLLAPWPRDILRRLSSHQYFKKVELLYFGGFFTDLGFCSSPASKNQKGTWENKWQVPKWCHKRPEGWSQGGVPWHCKGPIKKNSGIMLGVSLGFISSRRKMWRMSRRVKALCQWQIHPNSEGQHWISFWV